MKFYLSVLICLLVSSTTFAQHPQPAHEKSADSISKEVIHAMNTLRNLLIGNKLKYVQLIPKAKEELQEAQISKRDYRILSEYLDSIHMNRWSVENEDKARNAYRRIQEKQIPTPFFNAVEDRIVEANQKLDNFGYHFLEDKYPHALGDDVTDFIEEFVFMQMDDPRVIADLGSGYGFYSMLLGILHPQADIWIVDVDSMYLQATEELLSDSLFKSRAGKFELVIGEEKDTHLPKGQIDHVVLRNSFHHFEYQKEMLQSIKESLTAEGTVILVEDVYDHPTDDLHCNDALGMGEVLKAFLEAKYDLLRMDVGTSSFFAEFKPE